MTEKSEGHRSFCLVLSYSYEWLCRLSQEEREKIKQITDILEKKSERGAACHTRHTWMLCTVQEVREIVTPVLLAEEPWTTLLWTACMEKNYNIFEYITSLFTDDTRFFAF